MRNRKWGICELPKTITLKCDSPICDTEVYGIPHAEAWIWVDVPCHKCGLTLLTEKDHLDTQRLFHVVAWCNRWLGWLGWIFTKRETVSINPHHGKLNLEKEVER